MTALSLLRSWPIKRRRGATRLRVGLSKVSVHQQRFSGSQRFRKASIINHFTNPLHFNGRRQNGALSSNNRRLLRSSHLNSTDRVVPSFGPPLSLRPPQCAKNPHTKRLSESLPDKRARRHYRASSSWSFRHACGCRPLRERDF